jgi:hypothetical protein
LRTIIAGSRSITSLHIVAEAVKESGFKITQVVSGGALGVDRLGEEWAKIWGIPVIHFIPDWDKYGKRAGYLRNSDMANYADALVAVWNGKSRGTKHMIDLANAKGIKVYVKCVK